MLASAFLFLQALCRRFSAVLQAVYSALQCCRRLQAVAVLQAVAGACRWLQAVCRRLQAGGCRQAVAGRRLQAVAGRRLQAVAKNSLQSTARRGHARPRPLPPPPTKLCISMCVPYRRILRVIPLSPMLLHAQVYPAPLGLVVLFLVYKFGTNLSVIA
jgi:hypothetical protein